MLYLLHLIIRKIELPYYYASLKLLIIYIPITSSQHLFRFIYFSFPLSVSYSQDIPIFVSGYSCFCNSNEIRCADGKCVPMTKVMDGRNDCKEGKYDEGKTLFTVFFCF